MNSSDKTCLYISWDTSDEVLFSYYIVKDGIIKVNGFYSIRANVKKVFNYILKLAKKYGVEKLVVQNSVGLSKLKAQSEWLGSVDRKVWLTKLRKVDQMFQLLTSENVDIEKEIKDSNVEIKKPYLGKFVRLYEDGTLVFENLTIKVPRSFLEYVAYFYESFVVPGITFIRYIEKPAQNYQLSITDDFKLNVPLYAPFMGYAIIWLKKERDGYVANVSLGKNLAEARKKHRQMVLKETIKWLNETKDTGVITTLLTLDHQKVHELIERLRSRVGQFQAL